MIIIYYIQTMKRIPYLICNVNTTFIKIKRGICLQYNSFCSKRFSVSACSIIVTNPVRVILQIMFLKTFLAVGFVWQFLLFPKITMCAFIVLGSSAKFCHSTTIVLLSTIPTFYQIYHHFRITVEVFLY